MGAATLSAAVNPPTAAGTDTVTGFSIYTTEPGSNAGDANTVRMYSFDEEGHLSGNAITLNGSDLTRAKIATRNDFNGGTNSGVVIDQKLTSDSTPAVTTSLNLSLYSTKAGDLFLADYNGLTPDSDLSSAPAAAQPYPLLTNSDGSSFTIDSDKSVVIALSIDADGNLTNTIPNTAGYQLVLKDNSTNEISRVSFERDGSNAKQAVLSEAEITELELNTRFDIDGDGTTAFQFQNELLNSKGNNARRLKLSQTTAGLALYDNARVANPGDDISGWPAPTASTTNTTGVIQLLDPDFSIPEEAYTIYARQLVEWETSTQFPAGTDVVSGYELYTGIHGIVTRHSFDTDGSLRDSKELSELERIQAEMPLNMYLSGGIPIEELAIDPPVSISEKLTTKPVNNFNRALYQTNKGLLLSPNDALADLANPFSVAGAAPTANAENQFTLLLNQTGDEAFAIPGGDNSVIQTAVRRIELNKTSNNAAPTTTTTGYDLYTRDSNNVVEKFSFSIDGVLESQTPTTLVWLCSTRGRSHRPNGSQRQQHCWDECQ